MPMAVILATSQSISSTTDSAELGVHPKVTTGKSMPSAKGGIYGHVSAGYLFNQDDIYRCWRSVTSDDLLHKPRTRFCLTSEPVSCSAGFVLLR